MSGWVGVDEGDEEDGWDARDDCFVLFGLLVFCLVSINCMFYYRRSLHTSSCVHNESKRQCVMGSGKGKESLWDLFVVIQRLSTKSGCRCFGCGWRDGRICEVLICPMGEYEVAFRYRIVVGRGGI